MERAPTTTSSSRPGTQQQPKPEKPNWRISFGFWTELDALYHSFVPPTKPRCPCLPRDSTSEWKKRLVPDDIEQFLGNPAAAASLRAITSRTETDTTSVFTNFIISGGRSTGKATVAGILRKTLLSVTSEQPCHFASLNASEFADKALQEKLEEAVKSLDASKAGTLSFLIIERFESVTPSVQQHFLVPLLVEANLKKVFVILLVRPDANKLAEQIKTQAMKVHLHPLSANFVRTKLLLICQQERIGYTREGLEELAKDCSFNNADQLKLDVRKEIATSEKLKRELLRSRQALADLETQRYVFARDRGKTAKWGSAKKAADEQLARMDAALNSAKGSIKSLEQELSSRHEALVKLQDAAAHGRSRGIGKGLGRIELKQEEKQRNKPAAVAAV
ncbi:hypothetical protein JG688_00000503 [Phytophthora aleatoria]|uniref:Uncharacterized protein n=1 Tax=Phytophthora aleatoria TaxID=2496075 RepID=A0A8J5JE61_9STRA|nr:hypothetical protein JG688_00000503 [Phytophthora aleatoria]